jgi:hypothetical protein
MAALGSVIVELSANIAKYQSDMGKAAQIAEDRMKQIDKSIGLVKNSLGVIGAGFLANATFDKIKEKIEGAIEAAAGLKELAERTGSTVESLSGLAAVAKLSGTDTDALAGGLQKLSKAMIDAENGGAKTSASFKAIGLSVGDITNKAPDKVFELIARRLSEYQDGAEKIVIAQNLLGKAGANLLPVMKDIADVGELQAKVTTKQAEQALEYEKNLKRLTAASNAVYKQIALELVPVFNEVVKVLVEVQTSSTGVKKTIGELAADGSIRQWAENAALAVAIVIETFQVIGKAVYAVAGSFEAVFADVSVAATIVKNGGVIGLAFESNRKDLAVALAKRNKTLEDANNRYKELWNFDAQGIEKNLKKRFAAMDSAGKLAEDANRKKIDTSGLGNANTGKEDDPGQKILDGKLKAQEDFIASEAKLLAQREAILSEYANLEYITKADELKRQKQLIAENLTAVQAAYDKEEAAAQARIAETIGNETKQEAAKNKLADIRRKRTQAEIDSNAALNKSQRDLEAIQRRFDLGTEEVDRQQKLSNDAAQFQIDLLGLTTLQVQKLTSARQIDLALQERIRQVKGKEDENANVSIAVFNAATQKAAAAKLIEDSFAKQQSATFGASEAMRKYGEDAANVGAQIESSLSNAFKGAEDAFVSFVMTGKLSFSSLANSIISDLIRIQARKAIAGLIDMATTAFTGGSGEAYGPTPNGGNIAGARAGGGSVSAGSTYLVGEKGPELFTPPSGGTIIPNGAMGGGGGVQVNTTIQVSDNGTSSKSEGDGGNARQFADMINAQVRDVISRETRQGGILWKMQTGRA